MRPTSGLCLLLLAQAPVAMAQSPPQAPLVLLLPGGTRALGVGNAWVAGRGAEVIFYNPAQIFVLRGSMLSAERFGSAATLGTLSTVGPFGKVWLGAGVQYLDYHAAPGAPFSTTPDLLTRKGTVNAASLAATVAVAARWKGVRLGAAAKYIEERIGELKDGGAAFDFGAAREVSRLTVALAVQNHGSSLTMLGQEGELPTRVTLGASLPNTRLSTYFDLAAAASVSRERDGLIVPAGGLELIYQPLDGWTFIGRAGARRVRNPAGRSESPVTLGASFGFDRLWIDYAFVPYRGPGAAHRIGIRIQ